MACCNCIRVQVQIPGMQGGKGETGATPEISASARTLSPASHASVVLTGTKEKPHLDFGIPKGMPGERGEPGKDAVTESIPTNLIDNLF